MLFKVTLTNVVILASLFSAGLTPSASANDSVAELATGGLVFTKSKDIEMLSEDLYISMEQIVVKYTFRNRSNADVSTLVAFPLPDLQVDGPDEPPPMIPTEVPDNFVGFTTIVGTKTVAANVEQKAFVAGKNYTAELQRNRIPLNPWQATGAITNATASTKADLRLLGLIDDVDNPRWKLTTSFYWEQNFPARQEITIEHRYKPIKGAAVGRTWSEAEISDFDKDFYKKYCVDSSFLSEVNHGRKQQSGDLPYSEKYLSYILTTGANWAAPIGNFHLVVDKGSENNLVSFCADGVRKIGPTQFEVTESNFVPRRDLEILILTPRDIHPVSNTGLSDSRDLSTLACEDLWYRRNAIFKAGGYCFKTQRAIAQFGNAGCTFDDVDRVPISEADRMLVDQIKSLEQTKRCPR